MFLFGICCYFLANIVSLCIYNFLLIQRYSEGQNYLPVSEEDYRRYRLENKIFLAFGIIILLIAIVQTVYAHLFRKDLPNET